jgi:hypothetical protein
MVTIGGIIIESLSSSFVPLGTREDQYILQVPILTMREKMALDKILPYCGKLAQKDIRKRIGFSLSSEEFDAYRQHYQHYPLFHEIAL